MPMATEKQLAFFKSLYDEEIARENHLGTLAKNNLSLTTLYAGFILFVVEKLRPGSAFEMAVFLLSIGFMLLAFVLSLWSVRISTYEAPNDPIAVINGFGSTPPTDDEFFDARIVDYAVASQQNAIVNDGKARVLAGAGYAILAGIVLHAGYFVIALASGGVES
jgi:hypothetical protein